MPSNPLEIVQDAKERWEDLHAILYRELNAYLASIGVTARLPERAPKHEMPLSAAWDRFREVLGGRDGLRSLAPEINEKVPCWLDYLGWGVPTKWEKLPEPKTFFPKEELSQEFWERAVDKAEEHAAGVRGVFEYLLDRCKQPTPNGRRRLRLVGKKVWWINFDGEEYNEQYQKNGAVNHLRVLLQHPNRDLGVNKILRQPKSKPIPGQERDYRQDGREKQLEHKLRELADQIKHATEVEGNEAEAKELRQQFNRLTIDLENVKAEKQLRSPEDKAYHAITKALRELKKRIKEAGCPNLAKHLEAIKPSSPNVCYAPDPASAPWQID